MSDIENLIEKLSEVDKEIITKPKRNAVNEVLDNFLGSSSQSKKIEKERIKILRNKKVMLINSHPISNSGQSLISLGNLALSSYKTTEFKNEKEAWKNKLKIVLNKLKNTVNSNQGEDIAEDYLFLSNEIDQVLAKPEKSKWFFQK